MEQIRSAIKDFNTSTYPSEQSRMATQLPSMSNISQLSSSQVFIVQSPRLKRTYESYDLSCVNICALLQCFCGVFSIVLGIAVPFECGELGFIGIGIWAGLMYLIAGLVGLNSASKRTTFLIVTTLVLSTINIVLGAVQFCLSTYSAHQDNLRLTVAEDQRKCPYTVQTNRIDWVGAVVIDSLLATIGLVEMLAAVFALVTCVSVICGPQDYTTAADIPVRHNRVLPAQFVFTSNQAPVSLGNQTYINGTSRG